MRPRLDPSRLSDLDKRLFARVDEEAADAAARGGSCRTRDRGR